MYCTYVRMFQVFLLLISNYSKNKLKHPNYENHNLLSLEKYSLYGKLGQTCLISHFSGEVILFTVLAVDGASSCLTGPVRTFVGRSGLRAAAMFPVASPTSPPMSILLCVGLRSSPVSWSTSYSTDACTALYSTDACTALYSTDACTALYSTDACTALYSTVQTHVQHYIVQTHVQHYIVQYRRMYSTI